MGAPWRPKGPDDLNEDQRARIRYQVLSGLRGRRPTLADRAYDALAIAALPAPHLVRLLVTAALVLGVVASATVASADALPTEPLYRVKLASEQLRLALAQGAQDRASVQLSMAEHRLVEAERLAIQGMTTEAIVATSTYGAELASAAAELATVERLDPLSAPIVAQLKVRLDEQQGHAARVAAGLAADPLGAGLAPVFRSVASFAPPQAAGATVSETIAQHAADVAGQVAAVADQLARTTERRPDADASGDDSAPALPAPRAAPPAKAPAAAPAERRDAPQIPAVAPREQPAQRDAPSRDNAPPPAPASAPSGRDLPQPPAAQRPSGEREASAVVPAPPAQQAAPARAPTVDPQVAREAAERAKHEAEKARESAEKAKEAAKKTPTPAADPATGGKDGREKEKERGRN